MTDYDKELDEILEQVAWFGSYKRSGDEPEGPTLSPNEAKQRLKSLLAKAKQEGYDECRKEMTENEQ